MEKALAPKRKFLQRVERILCLAGIKIQENPIG